MGKLEGKIAIITGSGKGIGKSYAKVFAREGAAVTVCCRTEAQGLAVVEEIKEDGGKAIFVPCDVANRAQVDNVVAKTIEAFGDLHILVNNAQADPTPALVENITVDQLKLAMESGYLGTLNFMQACFPYLKKNKGNVINTSSGGKPAGVPAKGAYASAKGAIEGLSIIAAHEWGQYEITVNVVFPGVKTEMQEKWAAENPERAAAVLQTKALRRYGDGERDIAPIVVFLASDASKYLTGQMIYCDGTNYAR